MMYANFGENPYKYLPNLAQIKRSYTVINELIKDDGQVKNTTKGLLISTTEFSVGLYSDKKITTNKETVTDKLFGT